MSKKAWKLFFQGIAICESAALGAGYFCFKHHLSRRPEWPDGKTIPTKDDLRLEYVRNKNLKWLDIQRIEHKTLTSFDGLTLHGDYVYHTNPCSGGKRKVVLFSHGYGGEGIRDMNTFTDYYAEKGYDICFPDHRTHGKSEGKYITFGALESSDLRCWAKWIVEKWNGECEILLHGWSMGAATAYIAAANDMPKQVKGLVFDCGYSSAYEEYMDVADKMFDHKMPAFVLNWVVLHMNIWCHLLAKIDISECAPMKVAEKMKLPVLFVHGKEDDFVPTWMGEQLYQVTNNTVYKDQLLVDHAGHVMSYVYGKNDYKDAIDRLIDFCMES